MSHLDKVRTLIPLMKKVRLAAGKAGRVEQLALSRSPWAYLTFSIVISGAESGSTASRTSNLNKMISNNNHNNSPHNILGENTGVE